VGPDGAGGVAFDSATWASTASRQRLLEPGEPGKRLLGERELGVGFVELGQLGPGVLGRRLLELGQLGAGFLVRVGTPPNE
jgi:hypothetical protein